MNDPLVSQGAITGGREGGALRECLLKAVEFGRAEEHEGCVKLSTGLQGRVWFRHPPLPREGEHGSGFLGAPASINRLAAQRLESTIGRDAHFGTGTDPVLILLTHHPQSTCPREHAYATTTPPRAPPPPLRPPRPLVGTRSLGLLLLPALERPAPPPPRRLLLVLALHALHLLTARQARLRNAEKHFKGKRRISGPSADGMRRGL
jgi:hypothetical protein